MNEEIQTAFEARKTEILQHLKTIQAYVKANGHTSMKKLDWGHVGDLARMEDELRDISDRINGTGEYAE